MINVYRILNTYLSGEFYFHMIYINIIFHFWQFCVLRNFAAFLYEIFVCLKTVFFVLAFLVFSD